MSRWIGSQVPELDNGWEQAYKPIHPSKGLLKAFRLVPGSTQSALNFGFWTRWRAQQVGLAGFLYVSLDWFSGPRTRERLEQAYTTTHPSKGLLKAFRLVPGSTHSAFNF